MKTKICLSILALAIPFAISQQPSPPPTGSNRPVESAPPGTDADPVGRFQLTIGEFATYGNQEKSVLRWDTKTGRVWLLVTDNREDGEPFLTWSEVRERGAASAKPEKAKHEKSGH